MYAIYAYGFNSPQRNLLNRFFTSEIYDQGLRVFIKLILGGSDGFFNEKITLDEQTNETFFSFSRKRRGYLISLVDSQ